MGQNDFCQAAKISTETYQKIRKSDPNMRERTFRMIAKELGANEDWVFKGEGEMMLNKASTVLTSIWESETYKVLNKTIEEVRAERDRLIQDNSFFKTMLQNIASGNVNFLRLINKPTLFKAG